MSETDPHMPNVTATDRAIARRLVFTPRNNEQLALDIAAATIAAYREEEIHLALERERQRDNRVYRAIKELLAASTPAERANLAEGLLVALDRLAEKASVSEQAPDHVVDADKMVAPRLLSPGETPTPGFYWATNRNNGARAVVSVEACPDGVVVLPPGYESESAPHHVFTDFYGPLTDPREPGQP